MDSFGKREKISVTGGQFAVQQPVLTPVLAPSGPDPVVEDLFSKWLDENDECDVAGNDFAYDLAKAAFLAAYKMGRRAAR